MRTTPPTTPTLTQPTPKFSHHQDPYLNNFSDSTNLSTTVGTHLATSGSHSSMSSASGLSTSSLYLNSPYAAQSTRPHKSVTSPQSSALVAKGKSPSGLCMWYCINEFV
jgi:hypothetical protein